MNGSIAGSRSQRVAGAGAAVVLVMLAVTVGIGGKTQVVAAGGAAPATEAQLTITRAMSTYYLPPPHPAGSDSSTDEFTITLEVPEPQTVKNVKVAIDLDVLDGRVSVTSLNKARGCVLADRIVTCALGSIERSTTFIPFTLKPRADAARGPAGTMNTTVTSANAPTVRHTTRVIVGAPVLTAREAPERTGVEPGSGLRLTPAFGNRGDTDIDEGLTVLVEADQATLRPLHDNCRYDKAVAPTRAQCDFPGPLPAGTAYETDVPLRAVADATAMHGRISYTVYRAHDTLGFPLLPASAPRGTGAPLGLRPVDGSGDDFTPSWPTADRAYGKLDFATTQIRDVQAIGFTIKGKVGQVVEVQVPYARNSDARETLVTLPAGISLAEVTAGDHSSEMIYCGRRATADGPVRCSGPGTAGTWLRVRIDERVDGSRGSVYAASDPKADPDQENNTAPVTVEYTD
ncbi:hypothetical protein [Streptomyces sp. NPDC059788]|uniref:hypothetical protein n=1 Tax=Streptomyces sp. NPDC059788 TaxID=3346948 RepID=UPI00364CCF06